MTVLRCIDGPIITTVFVDANRAGCSNSLPRERRRQNILKYQNLAGQRRQFGQGCFEGGPVRRSRTGLILVHTRIKASGPTFLEDDIRCVCCEPMQADCD